MSEPILQIKNLRLFAWHEWRGVIYPKEYNWIDIHWIWVHTEFSPYKDSAEINLGFLGFCVSIDYFFGIHKK